MAITARAGFLALLGVAIVIAYPANGWAVAAINAAIVLAMLGDVLFAASPRVAQLARAGDQTGRLGEPIAVRLTLGNPTRRTLRAVVRDAWPPSAGSRPRSQRVVVQPA